MPFIVHCKGLALAATEHFLPLRLFTKASYLTIPFGFLYLKVTMAVVMVVSAVIERAEKRGRVCGLFWARTKLDLGKIFASML